MNPQSFVLPAAADRSDMLGRIARFATGLSTNKRWRVTIEVYTKQRSSAQNRYLHGVAYKLLMDATGYEHDDIAEYCCGSYFGWKRVRCPKTPSNPEGLKDVPVRTTTTDEQGKRAVLSTLKFMDYVAWLQRFGAKHNIYIPDPNEEPK